RWSQFRAPPSSSGNDVVGAATIPPVGRYESAFNVRSDRITASRHSPRYVQRAVQSLQYRVVLLSASQGSIRGGGGSNERCQVIVNATRSPAAMRKSDVTLPVTTSSGASVRSSTASGPATAVALRRP